MTLQIVIPSHNRSGALKPLNFIPDDYACNVNVIVRSGYQEQLYSVYKDKYNVIAIDDLNGISEKRDAICRLFAGQKIWMLDDDCVLHNAHPDHKKDIIKVSDQVNYDQFYEFIDYVNNLLDTFPHGVVRPALFARSISYFPYRLNTWAFTNALLNLKILDADLLDYKFVNHTEDAVAFLNTIEAGYDSFCLSKWMIKSDKPGKPGGMTNIRTVEMINAAHKKIHEKFPQHTSLKVGYKMANMEQAPMALVIRPKTHK